MPAAIAGAAATGHRRELVGRHFGIEEARELADVVQVFHQAAKAQLDAEDAFQLQRGLGEREGVQALVDKAGVRGHVVGGDARDVAQDALEFVFNGGYSAHGDGTRNGEGNIGRQGACGRGAAGKPVTVVLERVGGQGSAARGRGHGPGGFDAGAPQGTQRGQALLGGLAGVLRGAQHGHDARHLGLGCAVLAQQRGERLPWADFEEHGLALGELGHHGLAEQHRRAHLARPVAGVGGFVRLQRRAAHARVHGEAGCLQAGLRERLHDARQRAFHGGAVEGVRDAQAGGIDLVALQGLGEAVDGFMAARHHGERGRVAAGDLDALGQQGPHGIQAGAHGQHGTGGLVEHGLAARDHGGHRVFEREHAGVAGGGVLADAVADHGVGRMPRLSSQAASA